MKYRILLALCLTITLPQVHCLGQSSGLSGTIYDRETQQPVAGAQVQLSNLSYSSVTDSSGTFNFPKAKTGSYLIGVSAPGYAEIHEAVSFSEGAGPIELKLERSASYLDEVVVSAQKKEELLRKVPMSITSISAREAEEYRLWNITDLTGVASNLYTSHPGDNRNVSAIRGIVSTSYDQAVATCVDGVSQFGLDTYIPYLFDVEKIEVLKGPQGTLYGRNAMGGVINVTTRRPGNKTEVLAQANLGSYGLQRYNAAVRLPVVKDKLFFGAAGLYQSRKGFYTNEFNNSTYDKQSTVIGNYYLTYIPAAKWSLTLNAKHSHNRNNGAFPLVAGVEEAFNKPFLLSQNAITKMVDNTINTSLSIVHAGSSINFSSQTAYQSNHRYYTDPIDADFSPLDGISIINNYGREWNKMEVLTQELNFSSAAKHAPLRWTAGTYLFKLNNPVRQTTSFGNDAPLLGIPDSNFSMRNTTRSTGWGAAVYGAATYALTPKLELTGGLRYDHEHKEQQILGEYLVARLPDPLFEYRPDTTGEASFDALSPKLALAFYPNERHTLYVSYNRGFRAGGLTPISSDPSVPALYPFQPEFSNNYELGAKNSLLNKRLLLNVAMFYAHVTNVQVPTLVLPEAVTITRNTGRLTSKGVEADIQVLPLKGLNIDFSFGYTDARYEDLKVAGNGAEQDLKGTRQVFTPDMTSMLAVQYSYEINRKRNIALSVRGEWKYLGQQYFDLANTIGQTSYHLFNTRFGVTSRNIDLMFWGRNLGNERFISYAYDFGAVHLGEPRTYGVTVTARF